MLSKYNWPCIDYIVCGMDFLMIKYDIRRIKQLHFKILAWALDMIANRKYVYDLGGYYLLKNSL